LVNLLLYLVNLQLFIKQYTIVS